jgi:transposase
MMTYPTDLSDAEFRYIEPYLPAANRRGRPKIHDPREILNAVFYVLKSGCPWRLLPREFPPWRSVYHWFRRWRIDGTWERLNSRLREGRGGLGRRRRGGAQASKAGAGGGGQGLGWGVGQGRRESRLAKAHGAAKLSGVAEEVGGAEDLLLALAESPYELRDYEKLCVSAEAFV